VVTVVALAPLLVSPGHPFHRFLAAVLSVALTAKLFDAHLGAGRGYRPGPGEFAAFLLNPAVIVLRKIDQEPRPSRADDLRRLVVSSLEFAGGAAVFTGCYFVDWRRLPLALEHSAKVVAFFLAIVPGSAALASAIRLLGGRARKWMDNPFAAATPADFWRRYNRPAQQFFYEDVFKPCGGLRLPVRAALATFAVSALLHEYIFAVATWRVRGFQTAFFMIQGVAAVATMGVVPRGWRKAPWVAGTFAFNLATAVLFFTCLNDTLPFYQRRTTADAHTPVSRRGRPRDAVGWAGAENPSRGVASEVRR
jgi:hypothetical protein